MLATASIIAMVFFIIFFVVQSAVYSQIDRELAYEAGKHQKEIFIKNDSIIFIHKDEWAEREHREVQVNPVFIQIVSPTGKLMDKSPNLKEGNLLFSGADKIDNHFDTQLNSQVVRQIQLPLKQDGSLKGYILAALSLDGAIIVITSLKKT